MKKIILALLLAAVASGAYGQQKTSQEKREIRKRNDLLWRQSAKYAFGIHTGIDIGAAVPYPWGSMGTSHMSAVPRLSPALGVSVTSYPVDRFTATLETTYKQVGVDAKARVDGQRFTLVDDDGTRVLTEFRGTAHVKMAFSMLEIPLYIGYSLGDGRSRVYLGGYYSRVFQADFTTMPYKGVVVNPDTAPGDIDSIIEISPDNPIDKAMMPAFNTYLRRWDAGMLAGYEWQVVPRVNITGRVSMGFVDIFKKGNNYLDYKMLHMRGSIGVSYSFLRY